MSYGSAADVAALSGMWTTNGVFTTTSPVKLSSVTTWLGQVSQLVDTAMSDEGFVTPVVVTVVVGEIDLLVNGIVKDVADWSKGSGRFFTKKALEAGLSPFMTIDKEVHEWVQRKSIGFEAQGVPKRTDFRGRHRAVFEVLNK